MPAYRKLAGRIFGVNAALGAMLLLSGCGSRTAPPPAAAILSDSSGIDRENDGANWPAYGRTYSEAHESPLTQINAGNVHRLGLTAWTDLGNDPNGATVPIAIDGTVYATVGQSIVHAVDAPTGKEKWVYDSGAAKLAGGKLRFGWGARGVAYWRGLIYVGTTDGRLIALDAKTGKERWSVLTTQPGDYRYITGAPRVFRGLVVIGHGGADVAPTRGYVTAYDAETGKQRWRWFTVPGDPAKPFENEAMARAAKTWTGQWWKFGGGGTVWNAITYDPEQNLVYLGTGNGAPHNRKIRSPGGGDNLYLASIVALDADTGTYRWHYQVSPGEAWDYNEGPDITMATIAIDGKPRKVLLHAPKNGFVYVIDRVTGKLISADPFAKVTWATGYDLKTGRPIETANARYNTPALIWPGQFGAHNWAPMSYNRTTGLLYIPTTDMPGMYDDSAVNKAHWQYRLGGLNTGYAMSTAVPPKNSGVSYLQAWDPVRRKQVWKVALPGVSPGGTMTTAGNLVFEGQPDGHFNAYAADTGRKLWSFDAGLGISGAPISFSVKGRQFVAVVAGWGASGAATLGPLADFGWQARLKHNHLFIFALDGKTPPPQQVKPREIVPVDDKSIVLEPALVARGADAYARTCFACHGAAAISSGFAPDLRASPVPLDAAAFRSVVHDGALVDRGMPQYQELSDDDLAAYRQYIRARARGQ